MARWLSREGLQTARGDKERKKERGIVLKARQFNREVSHMSIGEIGAQGDRVKIH
jgi:hypothetical protein